MNAPTYNPTTPLLELLGQSGNIHSRAVRHPVKEHLDCSFYAVVGHTDTFISLGFGV